MSGCQVVEWGTRRTLCHLIRSIRRTVVLESRRTQNYYTIVKRLVVRLERGIPLEGPICQLITFNPSRRRRPWQAGTDLALVS